MIIDVIKIVSVIPKCGCREYKCSYHCKRNAKYKVFIISTKMHLKIIFFADAVKFARKTYTHIEKNIYLDYACFSTVAFGLNLNMKVV